MAIEVLGGLMCFAVVVGVIASVVTALVMRSTRSK